MSTKVRCPKCRYEYDLREAAKEQALVEVIKMQAEFGAYSRLVFEYAELFNATRPMKAAKLLRVLTEIKEVWTSGNFSFQKTRYTISRDGMAQAIKVVCNKNFTTPLENHNYLLKVMVSAAEQEAQKRSSEAEKALLKKETALRAGVRKEEPVRIEDVMKGMPWRKGF